MSTSRRQFLQYSLTAASLLALGPRALAGPDKKKSTAAAKKKLKILVLGGTGFLGPAFVTAAQARGHTLTLFNRGKTRPELFPNVEKLQGDRDPKKGEGLKALEGRKWDAVLDTSGYYPRMVKASAELLAPNVEQYVFISSISAYANNDEPHEDESGPTAKLADPTVETMGKNFENFGGLKRLCEEAAETAFPDRATLVRPGYIVGPEDRSDRFTYWPVRYDEGRRDAGAGQPGGSHPDHRREGPGRVAGEGDGGQPHRRLQRDGPGEAVDHGRAAGRVQGGGGQDGHEAGVGALGVPGEERRGR